MKAPPPSLVPPADTIRPPQQTIPEFPPPPALPDLGTTAEHESLAARPSGPPTSIRTPSLPPMPDVEPILQRATAAHDRQDLDEALEHYKQALFVAPPDATGVRASLYASIGDVKLAQKKHREAEANFEKALAANPIHLRSIDGLVAAALAEREWDRVAAARRRRADVLADPSDKAAELCILADVQEGRLRDVAAAIDTLEEAKRYQPDNIGILIKLRDDYLLTRQWTKLYDALEDLVRIATDHRHRGAFRFAQADVVLARFRQEPRGLALLEMALDEDPQCDRALTALVAVRTRREEWAELAAVYERVLERFAGIRDVTRAQEVCRRLGILRRDRLHDGPGALEALRGAVDLRPDDAESRASLAELYAAKGDRTAAVHELELVARHAPFRAHTYRRLFDLHERASRADRAWLVATCLEELSVNDVSHDLVLAERRSEGAIRPTRSVADAWWNELIVAEGADPIVERILLTIGRAAIELRLEDLVAQKALFPLDPAARQDPASTSSLVRTLAWAARALEIDLPALYFLSQVPSGIAAVPSPSPATAVAPASLVGRGVQELAFFAGRHLTYYRPAHYPLVFFPTLGEVSSLVLSAVRLVIPGLSIPPPPEGTRSIGDRLAERLTPEERSRLEVLVGELDARGGTLDLFAWIRSVELTATRIGLVLSGDLRVASRILKNETTPGGTAPPRPAIAELTLEQKRGDLLAFSASEAYGELRARLGVTLDAPPEPS